MPGVTITNPTGADRSRPRCDRRAKCAGSAEP